MKVYLALPRCFCAGVERAIRIVELALERFGPPAYVRKEIVHNRYVVDCLRRRGAVFVESLEEVPAGNRVIFSAHGVGPEVYEEARRRNLEVIDATCPLVRKVHQEVLRFVEEGCHVILIGRQGHDEVIGTLGQAPGKVTLVENAEQARSVYVPPHEKLAVLTQTTLSVDDTRVVIEALERGGLEWDFASDRHPRLVKMLLCATATETNANREGGDLHPTLERNAGGPDGFAVGKDRYEGYGLINVDAAVEAAASVHTPGSPVSVELAGGPADRRAWASKVDLAAGCGIEVWLENPDEGDFDLYLYSMVPSDTGTPIILASSATPQAGAEEFLRYTAQTDCAVLLVVKRVSGSGAFRLDSARLGTVGR